MNYLKIYETLIDRGRGRVTGIARVKGFDRHRIISGSEGGKYTIENISQLTRKEHRVVHKVRFKLWEKPADMYAYQYLEGKVVVGIPKSKEHRKNIGEANKGKKHPKLAEFNKGYRGLVSCYDINGNFLRVTKEEFWAREDLKALNKGRLGMNKGNKRPDLAEYNRRRYL